MAASIMSPCRRIYSSLQSRYSYLDGTSDEEPFKKNRDESNEIARIILETAKHKISDYLLGYLAS
ncbi:hypothetical protein K449DRAFT_386105 [Hypoxylon sp. EC38]|nr:hypothetical protein K449DRAFT_386105 [Hypoxylon sp. EC38]